MNKSLRRLDVVKDTKTNFRTQISNVTLKKGRPVNFSEIANAIDQAGFTVGEITISAKGFFKISPSAAPVFKVSGSNQVFPVVENEKSKGLRKAANLKSKEVEITARVAFNEKPPRWTLTSIPPIASVKVEQAAEIGKVIVGGMEVSLAARSPLTPEQLRTMMKQMAGSSSMQGMGGSSKMSESRMGKMKMEGMDPVSTHYVGAVIADARTKKFIPDLRVSFRAMGNKGLKEVILMPMQGSYANNIALPGKGKYQIIVEITPKTMEGMGGMKRMSSPKPKRAIFEFDYR